jgi:succinate dehydrogenase/fumarate reductase cytochrome b subunit
MTGKIPFSIGDVFYGIMGCWLVFLIIKFLINLYSNKVNASGMKLAKKALYKTVVFCCVIYILFNLFWGINYDRKGITWQLGLDTGKYDRAALINMNRLLVEKVNLCKNKLATSHTGYPSDKEQ